MRMEIVQYVMFDKWEVTQKNGCNKTKVGWEFSKIYWMISLPIYENWVIHHLFLNLLRPSVTYSISCNLLSAQSFKALTF